MGHTDRNAHTNTNRVKGLGLGFRVWYRNLPGKGFRELRGLGVEGFRALGS